jgi:DNA-binding NarL/FixJ family response regulator
MSAEARSSAQLTPRELEIVELLAKGLPNRVIADKLSISPGTLGTHLENIYRKLGVGNRTAAAAWYWGLSR